VVLLGYVENNCLLRWEENSDYKAENLDYKAESKAENLDYKAESKAEKSDCKAENMAPVQEKMDYMVVMTCRF
jgi:hypothetical protein